MDPEVVKMLAIAIIASVGLMAPALALAIIGHSALQGIARNPEASGPILTNMILIAALTEAIAIYALIVAIILALVV